MHILKSSNFIRFCHFSVAQNTKYLKLIFCMFVEYTIGYIQDFSQFSLKILFRIFKSIRITGARKPKTFFKNFLIKIYNIDLRKLYSDICHTSLLLLNKRTSLSLHAPRQHNTKSLQPLDLSHQTKSDGAN